MFVDLLIYTLHGRHRDGSFGTSRKRKRRTEAFPISARQRCLNPGRTKYQNYGEKVRHGMDVRIDYPKKTAERKPPAFMFTTFANPLRCLVHLAVSEKTEPRVEVFGAGLAGRELTLTMSLAEFRGILAAVVASGALPGLNRADLATAERVLTACLAAIPVPMRLPGS